MTGAGPGSRQNSTSSVGEGRIRKRSRAGSLSTNTRSQSQDRAAPFSSGHYVSDVVARLQGTASTADLLCRLPASVCFGSYNVAEAELAVLGPATLAAVAATSGTQGVVGSLGSVNTR